MRNWRPVLAGGSAAVLLFSTSLAAQNAQPRKMSNAERKEIQTILKIVDDVAAGQPARNELSLAWAHNDVMKAQDNKQYLPFSVTMDPSKVTGNKVSLYWRVVARSAAPAPAEPSQKSERRDDKKDARPAYAYEDLNSVTLPSGNAASLRLSRSFTVGPGDYDVFVVVKEPTPERAPRNAPPQKVSLIKQPMTVPNLWNDELSTSSVIVAERIDPLPAPLTPQQQAERPYALGSMEIVPATGSAFPKSAELSTFLLIYNARTDSANKPDVSVEYNFYAKQAGAEKFFNKTNPQNLNAQTLPPEFDFAAGHQLQSGQAVPLQSFPAGEYRLEIKVIDKIANKSVTRDVNFSVSGS